MDMDRVFRLDDVEAKKALGNITECLDPGDTAIIRVTRVNRDHIEIEVTAEGDIVIDDIAFLPED